MNRSALVVRQAHHEGLTLSLSKREARINHRESVLYQGARLLGIATLVAVVLYATPADGVVPVALPVGGPAVVEVRVSTSAVKTLLEQRGYAVIGKVRMVGGLYRVRALDPWGREVELVVDPNTVRILRKIYLK